MNIEKTIYEIVGRHDLPAPPPHVFSPWLSSLLRQIVLTLMWVLAVPSVLPHWGFMISPVYLEVAEPFAFPWVCFFQLVANSHQNVGQAKILIWC